MADESLDSPASKRSMRRGVYLYALLGAVPSFIIFSWMITHGTFDFVSSGFTSKFYDVQAISLLHGHLSMPDSVLSVEGITVHGRSYMYFGPALAVARLPLMAIAPDLAGKLSDLSMVAAFVLLLGATTELYIRGRLLLRPGAGRVRSLEAVTIAGTVLCVGTGSIVLFLASFSSVYQETELWAIALVVTGGVLFVDLLIHPTRARVLTFGVVVLAACMTRATVGVVLLLLAAALVASHAVTLYSRMRGRPAPAWLGVLGISLDESVQPLPALLGVITLVPVALYVLINEAKFGTIVSIPFGRQNFALSDLSSVAYKHFAAQNPTFMGLKFVPTTLSWYLRPDALSISSLFPFVNFPTTIKTIGGTQFATLSPTSSLTATMPLLVLLAIGGVLAVAAPRRLVGNGGGEVGAIRFRLPLIAGGLGCVGVLTYGAIASRYLGDFFPALLFAAVLSVVLLPLWLGKVPAALRRVMLVAFALTLAWSCWVNAGLGLLYQRTFSVQVPLGERVGFTSFRQDLHRSSSSGPSPDVTWGGPLPDVAPLGSLYVNGACRSLFEWNGSGWVAIEWSAAAGHVLLDLSLPTAPTLHPLPLLTSGTRSSSLNMFGLQIIGGNRYEITFVSEPRRGLELWQRSTPLPIPSSKHVLVDLVMDADSQPLLQSYWASVNSTPVIVATRPLHPATTYTVGALPTPVRSDVALRSVVAESYPAPIRRLEVSAKICDSLVR